MFTNGRVRLPRHGSIASSQSRVAAATGITRVCLVGGGSIAATHAQALQGCANARVVALVEPNTIRANAFAAKWRIPQTFARLSEVLEGGICDAVHILTPPDSHHALTLDALRHGCHVLVEKPLAVSAAEAEELAAVAREQDVVACVNQNFIFHPAFARLARAVRAHEYGPVRAVHVSYNVPLRQLAARQFGVWMFQKPKNILLEQAVHPLSQIAALLGAISDLKVTAAPAMTIAKDCVFHASCDAMLKAGGQTAHLQLAVGRSFPHWRLTAVCDDGVLSADMINNRFMAEGRGASSEPVDALLQSLRMGFAVMANGFANASAYGLSLMGLRPRSDAFFQSMSASIAAFHDAIRAPETNLTHGAPANFDFGANLVVACERMADAAFAAEPVRIPAAAPAPLPPADVAVIGATGFIGQATVARFVAAGKRVRAAARNTSNLPEIFHHPNVTLARADTSDAVGIAELISGVPVVVNLAHGGGGEDWPAIRKALVGGAENVAKACLAAGTKRLIHVGSIAGLYAGDANAVITGSTPPDVNGMARGDYARAKAEADRLLLDLHRTQGLPVCILRPGVVIGAGTSPFHSGLGAFNNEQHCVGWNRGANPLPFVLVDDVAEAIVKSTSADCVGRSFNLVGDVQPTARSYIAALAKSTRRPITFHPMPVAVLYIQELAKWLIKRVAGKKAPSPSLYDLRSRGLVAKFDCADAKAALDWRPEHDEAAFFRKAFGGP